MKIIAIKKAEYVSSYKIMFTFSDDVKREIDFEEYLRTATHPQVKKYLDLKLFKQFEIINGDIDWNDYELCFPIMDLYENKIGSFEEKEQESA
ncbi:MAG: DUF2442 domain-containing protein [Halobacteriovoraceae bacterium]|nr:DUF2442 domain-containing protein [Halobacteriovoraceae bacterium]